MFSDFCTDCGFQALLDSAPTTSPYAYADNRPLTFVDPDGRKPWYKKAKTFYGKHKTAINVGLTVASLAVGGGAAVLAVRGAVAGYRAVGGLQAVRTASFGTWKGGSAFRDVGSKAIRDSSVGKPCPMCGTIMTKAKAVAKGGRKDMRQVERGHVVARAKGGNNSPINQITTCARCNNVNGTRTVRR